MRIIHLLNDADNIGNGIINVAVDLACLQQRQGHAVTIVSAGGTFEPFLREHGVRHIRVSQRRRPVEILRALVKLARIVRTDDPDIVHAHMITGALLARFMRWAGRYALVTTVHNQFQKSAALMRVADVVIVLSKAGEETMASRGIPRHKIRVIKNGPLGSPRKAEASLRSAAPLLRPAILTVAGLYERKGIGDLIDAFAAAAERFPAAHLYIVGDGPNRAKFEAQARALPSHCHIHFEGFRAFPEDYMRAADIFVLASHQESFGLALAEARGAGAAVIGTAVDGVPELLEFGEAGLLVPPADPAALADRLCMLLGDAKAVRHWQRRALHNLDWLTLDRVGVETMEVYRDAIMKRQSNAAHHRDATPVQ